MKQQQSKYDLLPVKSLQIALNSRNQGNLENSSLISPKRRFKSRVFQDLLFLGGGKPHLPINKVLFRQFISSIRSPAKSVFRRAYDLQKV